MQVEICFFSSWEGWLGNMLEDLGFLTSAFSAKAEMSCFPEKEGNRKW